MLRFLRLAGQAGARVSLALACRAQIAEFNGKVIGGNDGGDKAKSAVVENNLNPEWMETHIFLVGQKRHGLRNSGRMQHRAVLCSPPCRWTSRWTASRCASRTKAPCRHCPRTS